MRFRGLIGAMALLLGASPALADVTLRYGAGGDGGQSLVAPLSREALRAKMIGETPPPAQE